MKRLILILVLSFVSFFVFPNELINSDYDNYMNYLELTEKTESSYMSYRSYSNNDWDFLGEDTGNPWSERTVKDRILLGDENKNLQLMDPEIFLSYNSEYAYGYNDGAMWQGRGFNTRISGGLTFNWKYFTVTFAPEVWFAQNKTFDILTSATESPFGYYATANIDYPQIYGDSLYYEFNFGQTDIRFNYKAFTFGVSTENFAIGPSEYNNLIMSTNASGFPHIDIGFNRIDTKLGLFELRLFWGLLKESDFYDSDSSNDDTFITGSSFSYSFPFLKDLTIGFNRVIQTPMEYFDSSAIYTIIDFTDKGFGYYLGDGDSGYGFDQKDQKISFTFEWTFPTVGFNIYFEFFREDYGSLRTLFLLPEHTAGYMLGAKKTISISPERGFMITGEMVWMQQSRDYELIQITTPALYYTHTSNIHGYTHKGQILGTALAPGGDGQFLTIDYYDTWGKIGLFGTRIRNNMDYVYYIAANDLIINPDNESYRSYIDVQISVGLDTVLFLGSIDFFAEFTVTGRMNMLASGDDVFNIYGNLGVRYRY
jgi:hypothetical protein